MSNTAHENLWNCEKPENYIVRDGKVIAAPRWFWDQLKIEKHEHYGKQQIVVTLEGQNEDVQALLDFWEAAAQRKFPSITVTITRN